MAKSKKTRNLVILAVSGLFLGILSWAFYRIIFLGSTDLLAQFGINNGYAQNGVVIGVALVILIILGVGGKRIFDKVFNNG